jgi:hypothetical protein
MCPSDIYQIPASNNDFGPSAEVFASNIQDPCSILIKEKEIAHNVRIQVMKDDNNHWKDYEEGELLIGKNIKCRLAYGGDTRNITIEVFHT